MKPALVFATALLAACNSGLPAASQLPTPPDMTILFPVDPDLAQAVTLNDCGDDNATCAQATLGPPFPLSSDPMADPNEHDDGVRLDGTGAVVLGQTKAGSDSMWIANSSDLANAGTVSRIDPKKIRELARYLTVTCSSNKAGSAASCDGTKGCCTLDDWPRYQARLNQQPAPLHQAVQLTNNYPSRTGVDLNGDLFISNRAFGGQSSVTKIAANSSECIDRNHNGHIDTSSDTNNDGFIETDCNGDKVPDDLASVKSLPCTNGLRQEFYGLDDECVLWTTNTFVDQATGRPLTLAPNKHGLSDVWAGSYQYGKFLHVDGATGLCLEDAQLPNDCFGGTGPYGAVTDASGYVWVTPLGAGTLCYFDTANVTHVGAARPPQWGTAEGYGITMDRDQNIWLGLGVERYTPDRTNGFFNLGSGWWTKISGVQGIGIAADSRANNAYFVWSCSNNSVLQIPASTLKAVKMDQQIAPNGWPTIQAPCYGVGVDVYQNLWAVDMQTTTRALVDKLGKITQPVVNGTPAGNDKCPAGDSCPNSGAYTYSDFAGFGLRNFTAPRGRYSYVFRSACLDNPMAKGTRWLSLAWDASVPAGTTLSARVHDGSTPAPDQTWTTWGPSQDASPMSLDVLVDGAGYMEVELDLVASGSGASPTLKDVRVLSECVL